MIVEIVVLSALPAFIFAQDWNYQNPSTWDGTCGDGKSQSPIDIDMASVEFKNFGDIHFHDYDVRGTVNAENNGHTELVQGFQSWTKQPYITGGGLKFRYLLSQFHFHWDGRDSAGSEHTIDGLHYPLELHFVHIREDLNATTAGSVTGGIAVVSVFFELAKVGQALFPLDQALAGTVPTTDELNIVWYSPGSLLPNVTSSYFRYEGSLTTPPCSEGVIWSILSEPNYVTESQLDLLRSHLTTSGSLLIDNWRPVQPLNGRKVYMSRNGEKLNSAVAFKACFTFIALICSVISF